MQLVEQGKIRLIDHVDKYIPEWKNTPEEESRQKLLDKLEKAVDQGNVHLDGELLKFSGDAKSLKGQLADMEKKGNFNPYSIRTNRDFFNFLPIDRESITIRHLLTHTSGLPSFVRYYEKFPEKHARKKIVADIAKLDLRGPVGGQFIYSDLGFITLGDIVERVSGLPLDEYSHKNVFEPLGMNDTGFNPPKDKWSRVAPTEWRVEKDPETSETRRGMIRGEVHDGNAWVQDGVSGHAGLFSTAGDVGIFLKMLMNGGSLNGVQILSPATIAAMMTDHANLPGGEPQRGLGWDLTSGYNGQ
jgi:CubicO group peptidase (beta-lactamase class C family)